VGRVDVIWQLCFHQHCAAGSSLSAWLLIVFPPDARGALCEVPSDACVLIQGTSISAPNKEQELVKLKIIRVSTGGTYDVLGCGLSHARTRSAPSNL
jgi:hypothetical protein